MRAQCQWTLTRSNTSSNNFRARQFIDENFPERAREQSEKRRRAGRGNCTGVWPYIIFFLGGPRQFQESPTDSLEGNSPQQQPSSNSHGNDDRWQTTDAGRYMRRNCPLYQPQFHWWFHWQVLGSKWHDGSSQEKSLRWCSIVVTGQVAGFSIDLSHTDNCAQLGTGWWRNTKRRRRRDRKRIRIGSTGPPGPGAPISIFPTPPRKIP